MQNVVKASKAKSRWHGAEHLPRSVRLLFTVVEIVGEGLRRLLALFSPFWRQGQSIPSPQRILVILSLYLGDTIVALPACRALKRRFPNARITFLTGAPYILQRNPEIDEVIAFSSPWHDRVRGHPHHTPNWLKRLMRLPLYWCKVLKTVWREGKRFRTFGFDMAIDLRGELAHALLMAVAKIPVRVGVENAFGAFLLTHSVPLPDPRTIHEIDYCLAIVRAVGAEVDDKKPLVPCPPEAETAIAEKLRQFGVTPDDFLVVIHPGCASAPASMWRPEAWAKVADYLIRRFGVKVALNGVANERPIIDAIKVNMKETVIDLCGQLSLPELIGLIKRCNLLLTVNSGPMHIGASLGTPMVVVQSAWNVQRWRPYGDNHALIVKDVPCANCGFQHGCPLPVSCMDMITPEEVIEAAEKMLQSIKQRR